MLDLRLPHPTLNTLDQISKYINFVADKLITSNICKYESPQSKKVKSNKMGIITFDGGPKE